MEETENDGLWDNDYERLLVGLGSTTSPNDILNLLRHHKLITLESLDGQDTCDTFDLGKVLGKGKSGTVFEIDDVNDQGLPVVLKQFRAKGEPEIKKMSKNKILYVLSSSLNDIVMSSIFHSFYDGGIDYSITFPYFQGFFTCGKDGYAVIEQLDKTMAAYIGSSDFDGKIFKSLLFQILYTCRFITAKSLVHNDMHAKNVMIRSTKGISYRGVSLNSVSHFSYRYGQKTYTLPNNGIVAKVMDFDFSSKYSYPQVVPKKVYTKQRDDWNLQFRFATSYDLLTIVGYMVFYVFVRTPGAGQVNGDHIKYARDVVYDVARYVVSEAEKQVGDIKIKNHYEVETDGRKRNRDAVSKLMDMTSVPMYRPYEEYCHLKLDGILDLDCFKEYKNSTTSSLLVATI